MTKKDFQLIADVVATPNRASQMGNGPLADAHARYRRALAEQFADALASTNPRFQRETFLRACKVDA